jgi:hypothetical protein
MHIAPGGAFRLAIATVTACVLLGALSACSGEHARARAEDMADRNGQRVAKQADPEATAPALRECPYRDYHSDFRTGAHQWYDLGRDDDGRLAYWALDYGTGNALIAGGRPLEVDNNHLDSGPLYLFAIAWTDARMRSFPLESFDSANDSRRRGLGVPCMNLVDTWLTIKAKPDGLNLRGGELVFWIQTRDHYIRKAVNYALTSQPLDGRLEPGEFRDVCVHLTDSLDDWTCMGSNKTDQRLIYGCSPGREQFHSVLSNVSANVGFIVRHDKSANGQIPPTEPPSGRLIISEIGISSTFPGPDKCGGADEKTAAAIARHPLGMQQVKALR